MKDFFGNKLAIGDKVAVERKAYRELVQATVIAFTPQKVRVQYKSDVGTSMIDYLVYPTDVVKKTEVKSSILDNADLYDYKDWKEGTREERALWLVSMYESAKKTIKELEELEDPADSVWGTF